MKSNDTITLAHGSGGRLMHELVEGLIARVLSNPVLDELDDAADVSGLVEPGRLAVTTDSFVVQPLFFPGGDIGTLAVAGTVNDLAVKGARPVALTLGLIVEEGLAVSDLERALRSVAETAKTAGVVVTAGDTKVVERGCLGGLVLNTAGLGFIPEGVELGAARVRDGDAVVISGTVGDHETAILVAREGFEIDETIESDCAPLHEIAATILTAAPGARAMRDPTRGGLATTLNELSARSGVGIEIEEAAVPVRREVRSVTDILGFDPLFMANEGKVVAVVPADEAERVVEALRTHDLGRDAAVIGRAGGPPGVTLRTRVGGARPLLMLEGVQLPRIC
ncbi:MAG: hydrogenase expression/formation protein HypE [Candidatus Eisenbacteria bacterium]|nr:hydrogenase expression/formation protein HypE [Candidatus Eisenbacteria bacterium]